MGFITSFLCGSTDSDTSKKPKTKNKVAAGTSEKTRGNRSKNSKTTSKAAETSGTTSIQPKKSHIHTNLSNSTSKMQGSQTKASGTNLNSKNNLIGNAEPTQKSDKTPAVNNFDRTNESDSEGADVDMDADDEDVDVKNEEKQTVLIYNAESDTSTGTTADTTAVSASQPAHEVTTIVREAENTSSAEDSEGANSLPMSDVEAGYNEFDDGELLDLAKLQPDQAHAPGVDTLLLPKSDEFKGKKCLVLDLDETLVHSSFKYLRTADFVIPVEIDNQVHNVYVIKRPGVDIFLKRVSELYEVVVFTASVSRYGDPLLDILDKNSTIHHRLFRDSCFNYEGNYIKNLSQIGRPLTDMIILDNSPASYIFHPQHAIPISSWFSDAHDNELLDIIPLLEDLAQERIPDVGKVLDVTI